jgi:tetratricopeptide (TPR) repeat protein
MRIARTRVVWRACATLPVLILLLAQPALSQSGHGRSDDLLGQAAERYARGDLKGAHTAYLEALNAAPGRFTVLHRLARIESMLAEEASGEDGLKLVAAAVEHAREAVKISPDSANGHLELAVALGRQALKAGHKAQLSLSREIKSEVDRTLALDPTLGRAWHVLALWNRKLASLNFLERAVAKTVLGGIPRGASMENAVADMQKAIELEPAYVNHRLEQGRTFMQLKRTSEARLELERAVALPASGSPLDPKYQAEARELLARLKKN